jgi:zinc transporter 13
MLCGNSGGGEIKVSGYLNLVANCVDNFAHGLAVGGAFLVDNKTGFVTTSCILCHEIPHEIGDFAILMSSGFSKSDAAKAQFSTALLGILGALAALSLDSVVSIDSYTSWIIPFTSGGFLHISLVTVLPDLMKSDSVGDVVLVLSGICLGISAMMAVAQL